jgi:hypothetical protein
MTEIPIFKTQTIWSSPPQKVDFITEDLDIEYWNLFVIWCLGFDILTF